MSNSFTNVNDTIVVERGLRALKNGLVAVDGMSVSYSPENARKGEVIYVPVSTARTAATYSDTYISGDTTIASATVTMNQHYKASGHLTEAQFYGASTDLMAMISEECAYALSKQVVTAAMALWDTDTFGNVEGTSKKTVASSAFDAETIADLIGMGAARGWDVQNSRLSLYLREAYYANLLKDPAIIDTSASGQDAIKSGKIRTTLGVDVYLAPYIPTSQETNLVGFFQVPSALAVAVRPIEPLGDAYDVAQTVSDPASGVSMNYRRWVDPNTGLAWLTYTCLYGVAVARATGGISILSA